MRTKYAVLFSLMLLWAGAARAELVQMITVTNDYNPKLKFKISFDLSEDAVIQHVVIQNQNQDLIGNYTLDELKSPKTVFSVMGVRLVRLDIIKMDDARNGVIEIQALQNYMTGSRIRVDFRVHFRTDLNQYELIDLSNGQVVRSAKVMTHYNALGVPLGIGHIETSP